MLNVSIPTLSDEALSYCSREVFTDMEPDSVPGAMLYEIVVHTMFKIKARLSVVGSAVWVYLKPPGCHADIR